MIKKALLTAALALALAPSAQAASMGEYVQVAKNYWRAAEPCPIKYAITPQPKVAQITGQANAVGAADRMNCTVHVAPDNLSSVAICLVVVHEYGHMLGLDHSSDPDDVMHGPPSEGSVPECTQRFGEEALAKAHCRPLKPLTKVRRPKGKSRRAMRKYRRYRTQIRRYRICLFDALDAPPNR